MVSTGHKVIIFRKRIAGLSASTLDRFVLRARKAIRLRDTVNVLVTGSREIRSLNRQFRGKDRPTDVLSFPSLPAEHGEARHAAGDVAICMDIARENAGALGHSLGDEIKILALHGILHLAGFDHENDNGEMARKERQLRRTLKLERGLIERMPDISRREKRTSRARGPKRRTA